MKSKKIYIFLIIILIVFFLLMYFLIGKNSIEKQNQTLTILTGEDTIFEYSNNQWKQEKEHIDDYNWSKFSIYLNDKYIGKNYVWHDDKWYIFDENKNAINYTDKFLGINSNFQVKVKEFNSIDNTNKNIVQEVLKSNNLPVDSNLTLNSITSIDLDNDNKEEAIYIISNTFPEDSEPKTIFSYVFMVDDNNIYYIYKYNEKVDYYSGCRPYLNSLLDIDNDNKYEILLSCSPYSTQNPINYLYKLSDNEFKLLISNE